MKNFLTFTSLTLFALYFVTMSTSAMAHSDGYAGYQWSGTYAPWAAEAFEGGK